jgi:hypothetical protein
LCESGVLLLRGTVLGSISVAKSAKGFVDDERRPSKLRRFEGVVVMLGTREESKGLLDVDVDVDANSSRPRPKPADMGLVAVAVMVGGSLLGTADSLFVSLFSSLSFSTLCFLSLASFLERDSLGPSSRCRCLECECECECGL